MKTPLSRPPLPLGIEPATWDPAPVAVFGEGERDFARVLAQGLLARGIEADTLHVELRHAEGIERAPGRLVAHPDALAEALVDPGRLTIGSGAAFAIAARARMVIWIRGASTSRSLPPPLRPIAARAQLVLRRPREDVARALAEGWPRA